MGRIIPAAPANSPAEGVAVGVAGTIVSVGVRLGVSVGTSVGSARYTGLGVDVAATGVEVSVSVGPGVFVGLEVGEEVGVSEDGGGEFVAVGGTGVSVVCAQTVFCCRAAITPARINTPNKQKTTEFFIIA